MTDQSTPITVEEFEAVMNAMRAQMNADSWHKSQIALNTLKLRGAPDPSTYSLTSLTADDEEDMNLKMHLLMIPGIQKFVAGEATLEDAVADIMPMLEEVAQWAMNLAFGGTPEWPVTITVEDENDEG
jgi:hypothetical protein